MHCLCTVHVAVCTVHVVQNQFLPDNFQGTEDRLVTNSQLGEWRGIDRNEQRAFVCQYTLKGKQDRRWHKGKRAFSSLFDKDHCIIKLEIIGLKLVIFFWDLY